MNWEIIAEAFFLGLTIGPVCGLTCGPLFLPLAAGASSVSRAEGRKAIQKMFLGRLIGYFAVGLIVGFSGKYISEFMFSLVTPYVFVIFGILFFLYGTGLFPSFLKICMFGRHTGPFLLGLATALNPCPPFLALIYIALHAGGVLTALSVFLLFFAVSSLFLMPLFILPAVAGEKYRKYLKRFGLGLAVFVGLFFYINGISALFHRASHELTLGILSSFPAEMKHSLRLGRSLWNKGLVFLALIIVSIILYRLQIKKLRYAMGVLSIIVVGFWLKMTPSSLDFTKVFQPRFYRNPAILIVPLSIMIVAVLFGRIYCGYMCPAGMLFEFAGKIRKPVKPSKKTDMFLRSVKYLCFALTITLIAAGYREVTEIEPFGLFSRWSNLKMWALLYVTMFLMVSFIGGRLWCRYLCPVGAMLALISRNCLFPKGDLCKKCPEIRSMTNFEGECMRCIRN